MAFENLIVRTKRDINGIQVDGVLKETTEAAMRVTTNPVEFGAEISDHIIREPRTIIIEGVITDTPLGVAAISNIGEARGGVIDPITGIYGKSEDSAITRSQELYAEFVAMLYKKELVEVQTNLGRYVDLIFQSIIVSQDKDTSRAVFFVATFIESLQVEGAQQAVIDNPKDANAYQDYDNGGFVGPKQASTVEQGVITS